MPVSIVSSSHPDITALFATRYNGYPRFRQVRAPFFCRGRVPADDSLSPRALRLRWSDRRRRGVPRAVRLRRISDPVDRYVLAHGGDQAERLRLELLKRFHGPSTIRQLEAAGVSPGWRCLEAGAGTGATTTWLAERISPGGRVLAADLETEWLEPLQSETIEVRQGDVTAMELPPDTFDLVLARMLLLHLPDPAQACRQLVAAAAPGSTVIIQDADFTTVALQDATEAEAEGLEVMTKTMGAGGVHLALGPQLSDLLRAAGADVRDVESEPSPSRGGEPAALITAITLERFRPRAVIAGASSSAIDVAIATLNGSERSFTGPTQWTARCTAR